MYVRKSKRDDNKPWVGSNLLMYSVDQSQENQH